MEPDMQLYLLVLGWSLLQALDLVKMLPLLLLLEICTWTCGTKLRSLVNLRMELGEGMLVWLTITKESAYRSGIQPCRLWVQIHRFRIFFRLLVDY